MEPGALHALVNLSGGPLPLSLSVDLLLVIAELNAGISTNAPVASPI